MARKRMTTPTRLGLGARGLRIVWSDGREALYPWPLLRRACPCAACREEWTGRQVLDPASVPETIMALGVNRIGAYALQVNFSDGHSTGIYTFPYLIALAEENGLVTANLEQTPLEESP